jgi:hypothetical protein
VGTSNLVDLSDEKMEPSSQHSAASVQDVSCRCQRVCNNNSGQQGPGGLTRQFDLQALTAAVQLLADIEGQIRLTTGVDPSDSLLADAEQLQVPPALLQSLEVRKAHFSASC